MRLTPVNRGIGNRASALRKQFRARLSAVAVAACFASASAYANPTNPVVTHGAAQFTTAGNLLTVTNAPNTIINWSNFSIGANEITRFVQQSSASAVLNRVGAGASPSSILGALQSNGRVFLINPNGITFGAGSQVNVAGLVASTLNLSDADFLAGRMRFTDGLGNSVINNGNITTGSGGSVYLVGNAVSNNGIITSPKGEVVLAAGNSVELVNPGTPDLRVEVVAPDNQAVNLGRIVADSGRVGIYAGLINHGGVINANSVDVDAAGNITLKATKNVDLAAGSVITANGASGGNVNVQSGDTTLAAGAIEAKGSGAQGGKVSLLGNLVGLTGNASVDASGSTGGGTVLIGGDYQGKNAAIQNAFRTYVGPEATIKADAITSGDGGKVIVWGDDVTRFYGNITARGGAQSGNGGFVEVSGKGMLDYNGLTDTRAPNGAVGTLLLDPTNIWIATNLAIAQGAGMPGNDTSAATFASPSFAASGAVSDSFLAIPTLVTQLGLTDVAVVTTNAAGTGTGNITVVNPIAWNSANQFRLLANNDITLNGAITSTGGGLFSAYAGWNGGSVSTPVLTSGTGNLNINQNVSVSPGVGTVELFAGRDIAVAPGVAISSTQGFATSNQITLQALGGNITLGTGSSVVVSNIPPIALPPASGTITIGAGGNVSLDSATVTVAGGPGRSAGPGPIEDGGNASLNITAGGTLNIAGSTLTATGGAGIGTTTGNGSILLASGTGTNITGQSIVRARGGGAGSSPTGRPATLTITTGAGGPLIIDNLGGAVTALIESIGGTGNATPGTGTTTLNVGGNFTLQGNAQVRGEGGAFPASPATGGNGSAGTVTVNFGGAMAVTGGGATIEAVGGNAGSGGVLDGIGGAASVTIAPIGGAGNVDVNTGGTIRATGGNAGLAGSSTAAVSGGAASVNVSANGLLNLAAFGDSALQTIGGNPAGAGTPLGGNSTIVATGGTGIQVTGTGILDKAIVADTTGTGAATVTLTATTGGISVSTGAEVEAGNGTGFTRSADTLLLALGAGGFINVASNSLVGAFGNDLSRVRLQTSGNATIQGALRARGSARVLGAGTSSVAVDAGAAGINLLTGANIEATGSSNNGVVGGSATVGLTAPGGAILVNGSTITATGGVSNTGAGGGAGTITLNSGSATVNNGSTLTATGGNDTILGGGAASDTINATSGRVDVDVSSTVSAVGGNGLTAAGNGSIVYAGATGVTTGTINATRGVFGGATGGASVSVSSTGGTVDINGNVTVTPRSGLGTITVSAGNSITNSAGTLRIAAPVGVGSLITLIAANGIGATGTPIRFFDGTVPITATNGATGGNIVLSQASGNVSVSGWTLTNNFAGGAFDIKAEAGNINVPAIVTGNPHPLTNNNGPVILRASNAISIAAGSAGIDPGKIQAAGDVTLIANDMDVQGSVIANVGTGIITIQTTTAGRPIDLGLVGPSATSLALDNAEIGRMSAASLVIGSGTSPIVNGGPITVASNLTINTPGLPISLGNTGNDFQGTVSLSGGNVTVADANTLTLGTSNVTGTLNVTASGALSQTGPLTVTGSTSINAGANPVTLTGANDFQGPVALTASTASINDANALQLSAVNVSGALSLTTGGAVTQFAGSAVNVAGTTTVDAGANPITLIEASNNFGSVVSLRGGVTQITDINALILGTLATGALTARSNGALDLGQGTVSGNLVANSTGGAISQTGALNVTGTSAINAGAGAITLTNAANDFVGALSLTGGATALSDANGVVIGASNVGALSLAAPATTIQGATNAAGNFTLPSGALTISSGGSLGVSGATNIAAGATLATAGGTFNALGPVSVGGTLQGSAGGPINAVGQAITVSGLLNLNGGSVTASDVNVTGGTLKGIGSISGNVTNSGTVAPGASPGIITIGGNYTQTSAGVLVIEVGGTTPGSGYDQLQVSGNANLAGNLVISQFGGFAPTASDTFQIITTGGSVTGAFNVPSTFGGLGASYQSNLVQLAGSALAFSGVALDPRIVNEDKDIFSQTGEEDDIFSKLDGQTCN